ncbi:DUF1045 domain-containing protein [Mesorhizobium retamae]|uniref:DUF1045 domain-containing protein n=1 Tax=Mesorhizobium retamae TaxID=2912854 RepID=UPI003CCFE22F
MAGEERFRADRTAWRGKTRGHSAHNRAPAIRVPRDAESAVPSRPGSAPRSAGGCDPGFVQARSACPLGPLRIANLGRFFALVPSDPVPGLQDFAGQVVSEFDRFRASMTPQDLRRRLKPSLDEEESIGSVST